MKKLLLASLLFISACSTTNIRISDEMPPIKPNYKEMQHFFVAGIGQEKIQEPKEICGSLGVNSVKVYYGFIDSLAVIFTGGIYTPNTYEVYCNRTK
jgi:hypothetical protein